MSEERLNTLMIVSINYQLLNGWLFKAEKKTATSRAESRTRHLRRVYEAVQHMLDGSGERDDIWVEEPESASGQLPASQAQVTQERGPALFEIDFAGME